MHYIYYYINEIRLRIFYVILAWILTFVIGYIHKYELFYIISKPFLNFHTKFLFFELTEGLYTMIHIVSIISLLLIFPFIFYHIWSFLSPSWYISERKAYRKILYIFFQCFLLEFFCIYFFIFPRICEFLMTFEMHSLLNPESLFVGLEFVPRITSYIKILSRLFLGCLVVFQLPFLFLWCFTKKIIQSHTLCQQRKPLFFLCLVISALISPPDLISQCIISIIFYGIFEIIIFIGFFYDFHEKYKTYENILKS